MSCHVQHLDDPCLLNIFRFLLPLPDLFNVARTCKRFQGLMHDKRMWLVVQPTCTGKERLSGKVFVNLRAAIRASRPGDTIWLSPDSTHEVSDLTVPWPLHLVGGGQRPEDTVLLCPAGADTALDFRATGKLANLRVVAERGACVVHRRGQLRVERCVLECRALGLHHLCAPLVTLASICHPPRAQLFQGAACMTGVGFGSLHVAETQLVGGSPGVRCHGSGALQSVRVLYHAPAPLFWLLVDSRTPGHFPPSRPGLVQAPLVSTPSITTPVRPCPPAPATPAAPERSATCPRASDGILPKAATETGATCTGGTWSGGWYGQQAASRDAGSCEAASAAPATPAAVLAREDAWQAPCRMLEDLEELSDGEQGQGGPESRPRHAQLLHKGLAVVPDAAVGAAARKVGMLDSLPTGGRKSDDAAGERAKRARVVPSTHAW